MNKHYAYMLRKALTLLCCLSLLLSQVPTQALASEQVEQPAEQLVEAETDTADACDSVAADAAAQDDGLEALEGEGELPEFAQDDVEPADGEAELTDETDELNADQTLADEELEKEIVLAQQTITATTYADASKTSIPAELAGAVVLEGMLPEGAEVVAWPVASVDVEDFDLLTAYEIQILVKGQEWQPEDANTITVHIDDAATREVGQDYLDALVVYHIHDNDTERLGIEDAEGSVVSFQTDGFSTFALGATLGDSVIPTLDANRQVDGVTYYLDSTNKVAGVMALESPATIHYQVKYGNAVYDVKLLSSDKNGAGLSLGKMKDLYGGKTVYLDDELVSAMYGGASFSLPTLDAELTSEEAALVADYQPGVNNDKASVSQKLWKKASYNPDTNQIDISLAYFQKMVNTTLDFIFVYDMSDTMWDHDTTMNGYRAARAVWASAALQLMAKSLLEQSNYSINLKLIPFTSSVQEQSGWLNSYSKVKDHLASSWTYGGTDHGEAATAAANAANSSSNTPVVVYISDIVSHAGLHCDGKVMIDGSWETDYRELRAMREAAENRVYLLKIFNGTSKEKAKDWTGSSERVKIANDVDAFISGLEEIVKESVGYYVDADTVVTDELSEGLMNMQQGINLPTGSEGGTVTSSGSTLSWALVGSGERLQSGRLYTKTISVDVDANTLVSGSMPTNGDCAAAVDGTQVNSVSSPLLGSDVTIRVACNTTGAAISGASFELLDSDGTQVWTGTSADGKLTIPYSEVSFPAKSSYTLRQTSTDEAHLLPTGAWKLTVSAAYQIVPSTVHGEGYSASNPDWMVDASVEGGALLIKNRKFAGVTIKNRVQESAVGQGLPTFVINDITMGTTSLTSGTGVDAYVTDGTTYTQLAAYAQNSGDSYHGKLAVRADKDLQIVVPDQQSGTAYRVQGALLECYNGTYVPAQGSFTVKLSDSDTQATVTQGDGATSIVGGGSNVVGNIWNLRMAGTLPSSGATITLGGEETDGAYLRVQNHSSKTLMFRLTVDGGAYGNLASINDNQDNFAAAEGGLLVEQSGTSQANLAPLGSNDSRYYEFTVEAGKESTASKTLFVPFAAGLDYSVQVFAQDKTGAWQDVTSNLDSALIKLCSEGTDDAWASDALAGVLAAGPAYEWTSADDNSFVDAIKASEGASRKMVNIALVDFDPNPPAPTGYEDRSEASLALGAGALAVSAMALCFTRRRYEDEAE